MPYSGISDSSLPAHVREMSADDRKRWIAVFNSVYARTHDDGQAMRQANGVLAANKVANHTGVMLALYPPAAVADDIAIPDGEPADDLHVTLLYFGDVSDLGLTALARIRDAAIQAAATWLPFEVELGGLGRFFTPDGDGNETFYASVDSPVLPKLRGQLAQLCEGLFADNHGFSPHMTLAYVKPREPNPLTSWTPVRFTAAALHLMVGGVETVLPLTGPMGAKYSEDQERDEAGRFSGGGISGAGPAGDMASLKDRAAAAGIRVTTEPQLGFTLVAPDGTHFTSRTMAHAEIAFALAAHDETWQDSHELQQKGWMRVAILKGDFNPGEIDLQSQKGETASNYLEKFSSRLASMGIGTAFIDAEDRWARIDLTGRKTRRWWPFGRKAKPLADDDAFWAAQKRTFMKAVRPILADIFLSGSEAAMSLRTVRAKAIVGQVDYDGLANEADQVIADYTDDFWNMLDKTQRDGLRAAILKARQLGTGVESVMDTANSLFGPDRAKRIAVSETSKLFGKGAVATYRAAGLEKWEWTTVNDPWVCEDCAAREGEQYSIDTDFDIQHPNCRCFARPVTLPRGERAIGEKYSEDQERDESGRFAGGGGSTTITTTVHPMMLSADRLSTIAPGQVKGFLAEAVTQPSVNLQHLQVEGEKNLFSEHLTETARINMPQLPTDEAGMKRFTSFMDERGITMSPESVDPRNLIASQNELDSAKVAAIHGYMEAHDGKLAAGVLVASKEGGVVDGHHRWAATAAYAIDHPGTKVEILRSNKDITTTLASAKAFSAKEGIVSKPFGAKAAGDHLISDSEDAWYVEWAKLVADGKPVEEADAEMAKKSPVDGETKELLDTIVDGVKALEQS